MLVHIIDSVLALPEGRQRQSIVSGGGYTNKITLLSIFVSLGRREFWAWN